MSYPPNTVPKARSRLKAQRAARSLSLSPTQKTRMQVLCNAAALEAAYQLQGVPLLPPTDGLGMEEAASLYQVTLRECQELVQHHRVAPATQQRRTIVVDQLAAWLAKLPHGRNMVTCIPTDLLVYLQHVYLKAAQRSTHSSWGTGVCSCIIGPVHLASGRSI